MHTQQMHNMTNRVAFAQWSGNQVTSPSINMEGHLLAYGGTAFLTVCVTQLFDDLSTRFLPGSDVPCCPQALDPDTSYYVVLQHVYVAAQ